VVAVEGEDEVGEESVEGCGYGGGDEEGLGDVQEGAHGCPVKWII